MPNEQKSQPKGAPQPEHGASPHAECEKKYAELSDKYLRVSAEFDNFKKRTAKEKEALAIQSESRIMLRLLPVYEETGLAESEVAKIADKHTREGSLLVLSKIRKSFQSEGLEEMKLIGEKLDPFRHEVAMREASCEPEGTIVRVISPGYLYKGEVLRHAIVFVSAGKKPEGEGKEAIRAEKAADGGKNDGKEAVQ
jgi:molecular chaperone GrpE